MDGYTILARFYDELTSDNDYAALRDFYRRCFEKYAPGNNNKKLLDVGCGTGTLSLLLAADGFDVTGTDISCDMLASARKKADEAGITGIRFAEQDMRETSAGGGFFAAVCAYDGFNYLTSKSDLLSAFASVASQLEPGGLLIFDMNTPYKYKNVLAGNSFVYETEKLFLVWQNYYTRSGLCDFYLTFFEKEGSVWKRYDETQTQRSYKPETVKELLGKAGFETLGIFSDTDMTPADGKCERFYIAAVRTADSEGMR